MNQINQRFTCQKSQKHFFEILDRLKLYKPSKNLTWQKSQIVFVFFNNLYDL
jgi:hypothetical protein